MNMISSVISLEGITKEYSNLKALDNVSFTISKGEVVGFIGANGAGKTTAISVMMGFINPTSGSLKLFDETIELSKSHRLHRRIGYAGSDMDLPLNLTGRQYLDFVLSQSKGDHTKRYHELCQRFKPQLDKKLHSLSRGNEQKVALIAAFMTDPELLIFDEPTSGLDPIMQEVFLKLIHEVQATGKTVFMSSHYLNEVADVCSRVIMMKNGEIVEDISANELLLRGGKSVRVVSKGKLAKPPRGSNDIQIKIKKVKRSEIVDVSFIFNGNVALLQKWVGGIKSLQDIEISEYDIEDTFKHMYESEEQDSRL